jgi:carboxymethylenebutenolidase
MTHAGGFDVTVGSTPAYVAVPSGTGPWPGVVVIHESWGLNADIRANAHRLGLAGYLALAPDLYGGKSFVRCLRGVFRQLHAGSGPAFDAIDAVRAWLAARPDCTGKTGVLGFCMGGGFALLCAPWGEFSAASVNYGEVPADAHRVLADSATSEPTGAGDFPGGRA